MPKINLYFISLIFLALFGCGQTRAIDWSQYQSKLPPYLYDYFIRVENGQFPSRLSQEDFLISLNGVEEKLKPIIKTLAQNKELIKTKNLNQILNRPENISKVYLSTNAVFELDNLPGYIIKMPLTEHFDFYERFKAMNQGRKILEKLSLTSILIPNSILIKIKVNKHKEIPILVEEKLDLLEISSFEDAKQYLSHFIKYAEMNISVQEFEEHANKYKEFINQIIQYQAFEYLAYFAEKSDKLKQFYFKMFEELTHFLISFYGELEIKPANFPLVKSGQGIAIVDFDITDFKADPGEKLRLKIAGIGKLIFAPMYDETMEMIRKIVGPDIPLPAPDPNLQERYLDLKRLSN